MRKLIALTLILIFALSACQLIRGAPTPQPVASSTPIAPAATRPPAETAQATAVSDGLRTPVPTLDFVSLLVTQAYAGHTPRPTRTALSPSLTPTPFTGASTFITSVPTTVPATGPLYLKEPIQIANAVNIADCKIRGVGDCAPSMKTGISTYFTWTFGVQSSSTFTWGQAAVVVLRDGQQILWTQVGNGLQRPPGKDKGWTLRPGQEAEFRAGLEKIQPGHYTARLVMCILSPAECNAGQGWQNVGGDAIDFVITP